MVCRLLGNARQSVHQCIVGQSCIGGNSLRQLQSFFQSSAGWNMILSQANALTVHCVVNTAGQHHVGHARHAYEFWNAHRTAATHKNTTCAFGQSVEGAVVRHANVTSTGQFQTASHHRTMQRGNDGNTAQLNSIQCHVPTA